MSPAARQWLWYSFFVVAFIGIMAAIWTQSKLRKIKTSLPKDDSAPRPNRGVVSLAEHKILSPYIRHLNLDMFLDLAFKYTNKNIKCMVAEEYFEFFEIEKWLKQKAQVKFLEKIDEEKLQSYEEVFLRNAKEITTDWKDQNYDFLFMDSFDERAKKAFLELKPNPKSAIVLLVKTRRESWSIKRYASKNKLLLFRWNNLKGSFFVIFNK